ncbi:hypothetical protein CV093_14850 [Oceanobacillus sp. 143]|uniref:Uncharacterized protein n=1 Tax=Oceanobacillus zhaokaii TaxID=2052660 RepID=A0A345PIY9_9BACI|nr:hypothetical protein [Oceanobacillus zhaokaii]AXI09969.1 hypothetical protein CUC15_14005 [Oceanobacillus zhaokaii]QGS69158.1 hypothetical protein CV093_14850 [Oceanobacillus sp. 143]
MLFKYHEEFPYSYFCQSYDANGNVLYFGSSFTTSSEVDERLGQESPISLKVDFFPEWINGDELIRIKYI